MGKRKFAIGGAVAFAVIASVAAIGVPAGWYSPAKASPVVASQPSTAAVSEVPTAWNSHVPVESSQPSDHADETALAARKRQHEEGESEGT